MKSTVLKIRNLSFFYNGNTVLKNISRDFEENTLTAITGPSGKGKSTFLSTLNRLWEDVSGASMQGDIRMRLNGEWQDIYAKSVDTANLRRNVGMVFQVPNPLPMSIYKNMAFPLKLAGITQRDIVQGKVKAALQRAFLWDEVKDRLSSNALELSGGQQQRLCIARALILQPKILLLDEPTSSLDAQASEMIENLLISLKENCTIFVVSHYMTQVSRIADIHLEMIDGGLVEKMM